MSQALHSTYDELVTKAQHYFWLNGYKAVTNKELAQHLDVSMSTIYNKFTKEMLFLDSLEQYMENCSDPVLSKIRGAEEGIDSLRSFFYSLIDALIDKSFPRSCMMVNTVVEMRTDNDMVMNVYDRYFSKMKESYEIVLNRAADLGEFVHREKISEYAEFLIGVICGLSILYKLKNTEELRQHVDDQLSLIV
jgi:TetR/AcrR family transcriptional regulator, transcriptional repressor for nem operon